MNTQEATEIITRWKPLLLSICNKYRRSHPWLYDDFVSDAYFALWKDLRKREPAAESFAASFGGLIATIITRAVWGVLYREKRKARLPVDKRRGLRGLFTPRINPDIRLDASHLLTQIPAETRPLVIDWVHGQSFERIAKGLGVCLETARTRILSAIQKVGKRSTLISAKSNCS